MAGVATKSRPLADGALPLVSLLAIVLLIPGLDKGAYALAALYLLFGAGQASHGAERDGEPTLPWRLYGSAAALLTIVVPLVGFVPASRPVLALPVALIAAGFYLHVHAKARHGTWRIGILSACGRRRQDARVGRTVELMCVALAVATASTGPGSAACFAVFAWLLTAASVSERPEPGEEPQPFGTLQAV
jgi:hypothetical protein